MLVRSPGFEYNKGELYCERVPVSTLAEKYGTPLYLYSATTIRERYQVLDKAFRALPHTLCFAVKANSNLSILRMLAKLGAGFDIVSGGELERVRAANQRAVKKVVFSGVGKTAEELRSAIKSGILLFNVESQGELELLARCVAALRKTANIALRVNPDVSAETHPYISTGLHQHKFGIPLAAARDLFRGIAKSKYLKVAGVSLHIGSQITDISPFGEAMERAADLVRQLRSDGHTIRFLDAGGGLGISYNSAEPQNFAEVARDYAKAVTAPVLKLSSPRPHLLLEPGRSIIAPAGALVTRVLYEKQNNSKRFVVVDGAMNDLLRPALYSAKHEITPVSLKQSSGNQSSSATQADVVGPICETGDFLARGAELPRAVPGDLLCVYDTGAYGMSLASNYNTRPRAAEVLVESKRVRLVRKRETLKDLLQPELACL
ncbi:MAG TPA: diaminopimelate decarboxylase [Candidatus Angelobacter sp.]|nr:diaminopimelate decarboxylase [Candidatus Angelobacter sp.]